MVNMDDITSVEPVDGLQNVMDQDLISREPEVGEPLTLDKVRGLLFRGQSLYAYYHGSSGSMYDVYKANRRLVDLICPPLDCVGRSKQERLYGFEIDEDAVKIVDERPQADPPTLWMTVNPGLTKYRFLRRQSDQNSWQLKAEGVDAAPDGSWLWMDREGKIPAREMKEYSLYHVRPAKLVSLEGLDKKMMDLLAVAWCAKIWQMELKEEMSKKEENKSERKMKKILPMNLPKTRVEAGRPRF